MTRLLIISTVHQTLACFLRPYAEHFRTKGWTVDGLAKGATESLPCQQAFDQCYEADWSRNPLHQQGLIRMPSIIRQLVHRQRYDLVHVHTPVAAFLTRFALRNMRQQNGVKVVYTAHGFHFYEGRDAIENVAFAAAERLAGRWTDRLVVINRTDENEALRRHIVDAPRLRYMPGIGLDLSHYDPDSVPPGTVDAVRLELALTPRQPLFLMVGEFNSGKRHRDLLAAFAALDYPGAHLAFAGTGPLMQELQSWCSRNGLAERVHFLGYRYDIPVLMRASLATILPSEREGLPRSVMESMSLGVPVIGSNARGVRDLLDVCGGLKVAVGDSAALRDAMMRFIQNPEEARRMGEMARSRMVDYDIHHLLKMHEDLYAELLDPIGDQ